MTNFIDAFIYKTKRTNIKQNDNFGIGVWNEDE